MPTFEEIQGTRSLNMPELRSRYGVKELGVFRSVVRGRQTADSDVDLLVSFEKPVGFLDFMKLESHLSGLLDVKVNLVSRKALKPAIGRRILSEVRFVA